ncbi:patatin-like phospholipase family protein [bacterium]|nr:patatin-like phospholipase family protein [bacterium]
MKRRLPALTPLAILLLTTIVLRPGLAPAQTAPTSPPPAERPRIGLVLGGGGARGGAHIGVLQVLMEQNIPIDFVAGTSMGAVIGSLYSVGLMPDEIQATLEGIDWDDLFSDRPARQDRTFRRKQDDTADFLPVEWGWKDRGVVLASAAISGQKLGFAFREPALYLLGHESFDDLPTPFRAVTTDLQTGEMFVPDHGNLLKAVRASMSIPGVFPPVEWDGRKLVDGYLARNLPVDVGRAMGADIIIAVDVGAIPAETDPAKLRTISGINEQKGYIGARQNVDPQVANADIVIQPDLTGISTRDFKRVLDTIGPGREAALRVVDQLRALALPQDEYVEHLRRHRERNIRPVTVNEIRITNESVAGDAAVRARLGQELGQPLDMVQLEEDFTALYDYGVFELVDFSLHPLDGGGYALEVITIPKHYAPNILNFGFSYLGGDGGQSELTARMRWTRMELNTHGGEVRTDFKIGPRTGLSAELYQPLTMRRLSFVALTGTWAYQRKPWYYLLKEWGDYNIERFQVQPEVGLRLGRWGEIRGGLAYGHLTASDRSGLSLGEFDGAFGGVTGSLGGDMLNRPVLPYAGWAGRVRWFHALPDLGSGLDYHQADAALGLAFGSADDVFILTGQGGTNFHTDMPLFAVFTLGGPGRISGLHQDQISGEIYALSTAAYYRRLTRATSPYATSWYVGVQLEAGNAWYWLDDPSADDLRYAALFSLVGTTFAGPLALSYGRTDEGQDALYLSLGVLQHFVN